MSAESWPKVSFGTIVFNGMPFLPYNVRALYPFAHEIIIVEGAAPGASGIASPVGHSRDGTLEEAYRLAREEDPDRKIVVVTAEDEGHPDGFWAGEKDAQSRAYARRASGDYLWQIDIDEFYQPSQMAAVLDMLAGQPSITAITFPTITFWGDPGCVVDGWHLQRGAGDYHRLFRWGRGYTYASHRPPTVLDAEGRDVRSLHWADAAAMRRAGIFLYHYSLLFPHQVRDKVEYYSNWGLFGEWYSGLARWLADSYLTLRKPFRVHNVYRYPSWLERFRGSHPPQVEEMLARCGDSTAEWTLRPMEDAEVLLSSRWYSVRRRAVMAGEPIDRSWRRLRWGTAPSIRSMVRNRLRRL